jgi:hypothetical protein
MQVGEPQQVNGVQWRIWDITLSGSSTKRRGDLGNWLVNWPTTHLRTWVASVYLERLARALHLRWCWFQWRHEDIPWSKMDIPCGKYDKEFFHASTAVIVGNGKKLGIIFGLLALELAGGFLTKKYCINSIQQITAKKLHSRTSITSQLLDCSGVSSNNKRLNTRIRYPLGENPESRI